MRGAFMLKIIEVNSRREMKAFVAFPLELYKDNPYYVPGIMKDDLDNFDSNKNPAFEFCRFKLWLVYKDEKIAGRIAAIINDIAIEKFNENRGRFGYVDFIDDFEVSSLLFKTAEDWLKSNDIDKVQGPLGFSDLDEEGMLTEGFDEMGTMTTIYNASYYPEHLKKLGYDIDVTWYEYEVKISKIGNEKLIDFSNRIRLKYDLDIVKLKNSKDLLPYINDFFNLLNLAYEDLYNITPLNEKQMQYYTKKYFSFIHPDFVKFIVNKNQELVAFGIGFPSLSQALKKANGRLLPFGLLHIYRAFKVNNRVEMLLVAVNPSYQRKGIPAILFTEFIESFDKNHITFADLNPQLEENNSVRNHWKNFETRQHKKRSSFVKTF